jgi:hypothetical protein
MHPNSTHSCTPGRLGDLLRHRQCFIDGDRATCDAGGQRLAFDQFDDERANTLALLETIDGGDVRMVERSQDFGLALKTRQAIGIRRKRRGQDLQRTSRFNRRSRARYTSPIPPAPSVPAISYPPSRVPTASVMSFCHRCARNGIG